jgi:hypothetical protein
VGKFSKIKKYSKPSLSVDEKIDKLNKELKKTGMLSEIANSTSGVYTITQYIDVAAVPAVPAVPPTYSNTIIGYRIVIPDGGSIYSPGAYEAPIYELIDPGSPEIPAQPGYTYTVVLTQNRLGDPNYFPGPIPPEIARGEGKPAPFTEDNYNWYNKVYGLPAAEWYRNNPIKPPSSNPFLPIGSYVPLALGPEIMNKWGMSSQAAQGLIAGLNSPGPGPSGASGPYTPVKDYGGGMGYGPSGPSRDPWGGRGPLGPIPVQGV